MKLPNRSEAVVEVKKLTEYLLNDQHPIGGGKSKFFKGFGFSQEEADVLEEALVFHAWQREVEQVTQSEYGTKYLLRCSIASPDGRNPCIVSVWIVKETEPVLVTAFPG